MLDLTIDRLQLNIENAAGREHRIRPITTQVVAILANRLGERWAAAERMPDLKDMESLSVPPVSLDWYYMSDGQAADTIAQAILEVLILKLRI